MTLIPSRRPEFLSGLGDGGEARGRERPRQRLEYHLAMWRPRAVKKNQTQVPTMMLEKSPPFGIFSRKGPELEVFQE